MLNLADNFLKELQINKNASDSTIRSYGRDLNRLHLFLNEKGLNSYTEIQYSHLVLFFDTLRQENISESSITRSIASIRGFFKYLELNQLIRMNPMNNIKSIKIKQQMPVVLTLEEVDSFLSQPDGSPKGKRDKAMLELLYASGIRASELVKLSLSDINLSLGFVKCFDGKRERIIPIGKTCRKSLEIYLNEARSSFLKTQSDIDQSITPFFVNTRGSQLTRQGFWKIVKSYAKSANINKEISPHILRHSFGCHLVQNGADLKSVQEMMGHESIISTQVYAKIGEHKLKEVYLKAHPRA